jgi:hypothetical protein
MDDKYKRLDEDLQKLAVSQQLVFSQEHTNSLILEARWLAFLAKHCVSSSEEDDPDPADRNEDIHAHQVMIGLCKPGYVWEFERFPQLGAFW